MRRGPVMDGVRPEIISTNVTILYIFNILTTSTTELRHIIPIFFLIIKQLDVLISQIYFGMKF